MGHTMVMGMSHHHPWRDLRSREHLTVYHEPLPPGLRGATDGATSIWLERRLLQVERRCTLTHELVHVDLGHDCAQDEKSEAKVRRITANRLIDWDALVDAFRWAHNAAEAADELWVTLDVLEDRLRFLSPIERALLTHITATT